MYTGSITGKILVDINNFLLMYVHSGYLPR